MLVSIKSAIIPSLSSNGTVSVYAKLSHWSVNKTPIVHILFPLFIWLEKLHQSRNLVLYGLAFLDDYKTPLLDELILIEGLEIKTAV